LQGVAMLTLYFCLEESPPVLRYWHSCPRIGDLVALNELGGSLTPLRVYDVVWEGDHDPSVSIYLHHAKIEHPPRIGERRGAERERDGVAHGVGPGSPMMRRRWK